MRRREWLAGLVLWSSCKKKSALPDLGTVPPFEFTKQDGRPFSSSALKGKVWVADFFFTHCPGPCPRMSNQLKRVQEQTAQLPDFHIVSITVDPDRDTPEVLTEYAKRYHADPMRWTFLTGRKDLIENVMRESFYLGHAGTMTEHSTRFVLVDGSMRIRGFYDSFAKDSIDQLIEDIQQLS
ncbi:SCO family protein [Bryobacter aggregatus]|uniref:SCO family protein n=1 Tax=Bryobacter aggregatus TaxID=360054 RepID=UPI0009B5A069|nr:SCO family protein [Bryobacter aggregatus]